MAYLGASPPAVFSAPTKDTFSGNASTKTFTLSKSAGGANAIQVFVDNVRQEPIVAYSVNDKTLNFTSAPASGTDNIYVINASAILSNGLLPTLGRDNDKVTNMEVTSDLSVDGQVAGNIMFSILEETDGGNLVLEGTDSSQTNADKNVLLEEATADINKVGQVDTSTFQFDNNVLVKGNVEIQGNLAAPSTGDRITIESGTDATTGFLLLDSSAASTDVGEQILFEDSTSDPQNFFNTNAVFGGNVKIGGATIEEESSQLKINGQVVSFGKAAIGSTLIVATDTFAGATDSVLLDFNAHQNFILTLDGNITLANPTTENVGQSGIIVCIQDGSGSRSLTLGGDYESAGGAGITLSTGANAVDVLPYMVVAANRIAVGAPQLAFA